MSHRCGGRHTKFHIRTLKEPWTERPILTFSRSQGTHQEPVLLSHNCTSGHRETDTPSTSHIPQRHEHQYTNIYSDKSRPIPPRVAPSHQPRACPLPMYTLRDRTRTGTHGISQTHTQPLLKYTQTHMYAQARVWGHTDAHTQHKPAIPLLCPLIHSPTSASTSGRHDRALRTEGCYDPSPTVLGHACPGTGFCLRVNFNPLSCFGEAKRVTGTSPLCCPSSPSYALCLTAKLQLL